MTPPSASAPSQALDADTSPTSLGRMTLQQAEVRQAERHVTAVGVRRVGVEDLARGVAGEHAGAWQVLAIDPARLETVDDLLSDLLGPERGLVVVVEVAWLRGDPLEAPALALAVVLDPLERRAGDRGEDRILARQRTLEAVQMVTQHRAAGTAVLPFRRKHEMVDNQPAATIEQLGQRLAAGRGVEGIGLLDARPGQRAALADDGGACVGELLLGDQQCLPRCEPFLA